jgi:hypothetical protein
MTKYITVTIRNYPGSNKYKNVIEFDELNTYLDDGWSVTSRETINSDTTASFSILFEISK